MLIIEFEGHKPKFSETSFIAQNATLIGDVLLGEKTSVWFGAVLRAELAPIKIGNRTNIQDNCVIHTDSGYPTTLGEGVTVGHSAVIHGATVSSNSLIGMRSTLLNGSCVGQNCIVAAGSLLTQGFVAPDDSLIIGSPASVKRKITVDEKAQIALNSSHYDQFRASYLDSQR
jgi:carbonic anhydrase/acetyltransferase-like protein (isoleucine patch superfamily)